MDDSRIAQLPTVDEALKYSYLNYTNIAKGVLDYKWICTTGLSTDYSKIHDWCEHLKCLKSIDPCIPLSESEFLYNKTIIVAGNGFSSFLNLVYESQANKSAISSIFHYMLSIGYNGSYCYDDFICDLPSNSSVTYWILGVICFLLCLCGIIGNLILLPAYNFGLNRSGATSYLTAMALFDCLYLTLTLVIYVSHYLPKTFVEQMEAYGQFSSYLIPVGLPVMQFCDLVVLWLTVAVLVDRLIHINVGTHVKLISHFESMRVIMVVITLCLAYIGCKFFEYYKIYYTYFDYSENVNRTLARVVLTSIGKNKMFQNLFHHWLKVPLEMFLPYLGCGVLISTTVSKMINLNTSKWKAVASLCNDTACACVCQTGVCGTKCREGFIVKAESLTNLDRSITMNASVIVQQPNTDLSEIQDSNTNNAFTRAPDPIEQELAYMFFHLPKVDETRENANVVTAVCIGLIMLLCKVPKIFLHIILTENYISHDPQVFKLINQFLDTIYASLKPMVCILVGAHLREALLSPRQYWLKSQLEMNTINNKQNSKLRTNKNSQSKEFKMNENENEEKSSFIPMDGLNLRKINENHPNVTRQE